MEIIKKFLAGVAIVLVGCDDSDTGVNPNSNEELIFQSGFEPGSTGVPAGAHLDMIGADSSLEEPNDWESDLDDHPSIGDFAFQYEGGEDSERYAVLGEDPENSANTTLRFWLKHPNVEKNGVKFKGRVQANIYNNTAGELKNVYQKVRLYLHEDMQILTQAPAPFSFLTVFEFWNNPGWIDPDNGFRITINLVKKDGNLGTPLNFGIHGQTLEGEKYQSIWEEDNSTFAIPIGQWLTTEIYLVEGDGGRGRFKFIVTPDGGEPITVFDITNFTHHPDDDNPDGLSHYNPMKLYTDAELINWVNSNNKVMQLLWDDFSLWVNKPIP